MQPITPAFDRAAAADTAASPLVSTFWLLVWAIAILDDADHREQERRDKRNRPQPRQKPNRPVGPRPF